MIGPFNPRYFPTIALPEGVNRLLPTPQGWAMLRETHGIDNRPYSTRASSAQSRAFMEVWQARCIEGYVAVHLNSRIDLGDLAGAMHLNRRKFDRTFKASFGCTPGQYVRRMRVARAQNLMTISRDPLHQIAMECGFADQSHFSHCFRRVVGESPAVWRARRCSSQARVVSSPSPINQDI
jgi:AraC-like DNA-binding protein